MTNNILLGLLFTGAAIVLFSLAISFLKFIYRRHVVGRFTTGMESGIFIEHGMVIDPETGLVTGQKKASRQAYSHI